MGLFDKNVEIEGYLVSGLTLLFQDLHIAILLYKMVTKFASS